MEQTPMKEFGAFDAKNRLSELLDLVEAGEEIVITRRGNPVARLARYSDGQDKQAARLAAEAIKSARKGVKLNGISLRELIDEGRP
jgi:prevent-host-death family protein